MSRRTYRADLGLVRERARRRAAGERTDDRALPARDPGGQADPPAAMSRREAAAACAWCGDPIELKQRGRIPRWCSATCRHRAWEQKRAAESGLASVRVVERQVPGPKPRHEQWELLLAELSRQLNRGEIYDRDLDGITQAAGEVMLSLERRERQRTQ